MPLDPIVRNLEATARRSMFNYLTQDTAPAPDTRMQFLQAYARVTRGGYFESFRLQHSVSLPLPTEAVRRSMTYYSVQDTAPAPDTRMLFTEARAKECRTFSESLKVDIFGTVTGDVNAATSARAG